MIFNEYYKKIEKINSDEEEKKNILESIARKFYSDYNEFLKKKIEEDKERKVIKINDIEKEEMSETQRVSKHAQKSKISDKIEEEKKRIIRIYYIPSFKNKLLYYNGNFYVYTPSGTKVERVPQSALGHNVLGRAFPGVNIIQILNTLYGLDFEEVKKHEVNHILYPSLTEEQIRLKTKQELPFYTRYH